VDPIPPATMNCAWLRKGYVESKQKIQVEQGKTLPLHAKLTRRFVPDCQVVTIHDTVYKGVLDADTDEEIRLETSPGVMTTIQKKDVKYQRTIREDGTLE